ncbi:MAG TPA: signal recognition particle-docking protein FtsY [Actinomycetales bacterium]|nr:signal recognition particle-docking protein FtsY [Actinomycetales bacterium]
MENWWIFLVIGAIIVVALTLLTLSVRARKTRDEVRARTAPQTTTHPPQPPSTPTPPATEGTITEPEVSGESKPALEPKVATAPEPEVETPAPAAGRLVRLRARLARSGSPLGSTLLRILSRDQLSEDDWEEIEESLLVADVGTAPAMELVDRLREEVRVQGVSDLGAVRQLLREELIRLVDPTLDRSLALEPDASAAEGAPATILMVGVNGTGKTTTVGKLARVLVAEGKKPLLGAADTFRAAAAEQLTTWGRRVGVETVRSDREGADPASVAFDAVDRGAAQGADVVLVDTAGRLQNKADLMAELSKIQRAASRKGPVNEVLLVLDATTGQNGLVQARVFAEAVDITGVVLTKLDGTAKGGIVIAVQREMGVPVKLVGLGEGPDDLAPFEVEPFVDGILGED